jgi:hypothetical protein
VARVEARQDVDFPHRGVQKCLNLTDFLILLATEEPFSGGSKLVDRLKKLVPGHSPWQFGIVAEAVQPETLRESERGKRGGNVLIR